MRLFTMPDIGGGFRDLWDYMRADRPHRWPALGLAFTVPVIVLYFFARSINPYEPPKRQIIYVESWPASRSDFDVRRDWLIRARQANDRNQRRREAYGAFARSLGQPYDEALARREFDEARATIDQAMRDLEEARAAGRPLPPLPVERQAPKSAPATATADAPPSRP